MRTITQLDSVICLYKNFLIRAHVIFNNIEQINLFKFCSTKAKLDTNFGPKNRQATSGLV